MEESSANFNPGENQRLIEQRRKTFEKEARTDKPEFSWPTAEQDSDPRHDTGGLNTVRYWRNFIRYERDKREELVQNARRMYAMRRYIPLRPRPKRQPVDSVQQPQERQPKTSVWKIGYPPVNIPNMDQATVSAKSRYSQIDEPHKKQMSTSAIGVGYSQGDMHRKDQATVSAKSRYSQVDEPHKNQATASVKSGYSQVEVPRAKQKTTSAIGVGYSQRDMHRKDQATVSAKSRYSQVNEPQKNLAATSARRVDYSPVAAPWKPQASTSATKFGCSPGDIPRKVTPVHASRAVSNSAGGTSSKKGLTNHLAAHARKCCCRRHVTHKAVR